MLQMNPRPFPNSTLPPSAIRLVSLVSRPLFPVRRHLSHVAGLLSLLTLSGCALPQAQSDPTRFYLLSTDPVRATPASNGIGSAPSVLHVREVELAGYLRSRPVIVRRGENEIEFREFALWGEPLESGIARVLREELLASGVVKTVVTSSARSEQANADATLSVRVLGCEGVADGSVAFRAVWEVATAGSKSTPVVSGDFRPTNLRWDAKSEASLAAQLSQAVAGPADTDDVGHRACFPDRDARRIVERPARRETRRQRRVGRGRRARGERGIRRNGRLDRGRAGWLGSARRLCIRR